MEKKRCPGRALNALIRDQVTKLRECGSKACILEGDRVALDGSLIYFGHLHCFIIIIH